MSQTPAAPVRFSARTKWDARPNRLTTVVAELRASGRTLVDLTESNPTRCALGPTDDLVAALAQPRAVAYVPEPLGHPSARAAVTRYYAERSLAVGAERVVLSASTSEAYGWLFKLLTDPGSAVLVPAPSYPLLDLLAELEEVRLVRYPLLREEGWRIDLGAVERALDDSCRAIVVVHPNNPTGSFVRRDDARELARLAAERGIALIVDEVFGDYAHGALPPDRLPSFVAGSDALTFVLSGLSKVALLPQLKLAWIAVSGPRASADDAMRRLEIIADTYLSVGTPVQLALADILAARERLQRSVRARVASNLSALDAAVAAAGRGLVRRLAVDGGWYALLEVPKTHTEDEWTELVARQEGVIVHPGYFFDFPSEAYLVVSLLPEVEVFSESARRVVAAVAAAACADEGSAQR